MSKLLREIKELFRDAKKAKDALAAGKVDDTKSFLQKFLAIDDREIKLLLKQATYSAKDKLLLETALAAKQWTSRAIRFLNKAEPDSQNASGLLDHLVALEKKVYHNEKDIEKTRKHADITLFANEECPYCRKIMSLLSTLNIPYTFIKIPMDQSQRESIKTPFKVPFGKLFQGNISIPKMIDGVGKFIDSDDMVKYLHQYY